MTNPSDQHQTPSSSPRQLKIDLSELVNAMDTALDEAQAFLDLESGAIYLVSRDLLSAVEEDELDEIPDWERDDIEIARRIVDADQHIAEIERFDSSESFRIMEDFVTALEDERARQRLEDALSRPKPFRRFKDALFEFPPVRERWFAFERERKKQLARHWLAELGIHAVTS